VADYFQLYARVFTTVELDSTFYAVPSQSAVERWRAQAPAGFVYSLKMVAEVTHRARLRDCRATLEQFCARARLLGASLGAILIQLPPDFAPGAGADLEAFLASLPEDLRFAVEFRHPGWVEGERRERLLEQLSARRVALALVDGPWIARDQMLPLAPRPTADFIYLRWMGTRELTRFDRPRIDRSRELEAWAAACARAAPGARRLYGYFANHYAGHSPASANDFKRRMGLPGVEPETLVEPRSIFSGEGSSTRSR
jgi:uncharacterized protein YecE (DUF72 family)